MLEARVLGIRLDHARRSSRRAPARPRTPARRRPSRRRRSARRRRGAPWRGTRSPVKYWMYVCVEEDVAGAALARGRARAGARAAPASSAAGMPVRGSVRWSDIAPRSGRGRNAGRQHCGPPSGEAGLLARPTRGGHDGRVAAPAPVDLGGLLEREQPLAALRDALADAAGGQGRLVLVAGEAGIGKTALLRASAGRAGAATRLWGACDALSRHGRSGPLVDIAAEPGGALAGAARRGGSPTRLSLRSCERPARGGRRSSWWRICTGPTRRRSTSCGCSAGGIAGARARHRHLPRRRAGAVTSPAHRARRARHPPGRGAAPRSRRSRPARSPSWRRRRVDPGSSTGRPGQPVLRHRGARRGRGRGSAHGARRGAGAGRAAGPSARRCSTRSRSSRLGVELWLLEALAGAGRRARRVPVLGDAHARTARAFRHELARLAIEETIAPRRRVGCTGRRSPARRAAPRRARFRAPGPSRRRGARRRQPCCATRRRPGPRRGLGAHREAAAQYGRALRFAEALRTAAAGRPPASTPTRATSRNADDAIAAGQELIAATAPPATATGRGRRCPCSRSVLCSAEGATEAAPGGRRAVALLEGSRRAASWRWPTPWPPAP